jgi:hypothetical protein
VVRTAPDRRRSARDDHIAIHVTHAVAPHASDLMGQATHGPGHVWSWIMHCVD